MLYFAACSLGCIRRRHLYSLVDHRQVASGRGSSSSPGLIRSSNRRGKVVRGQCSPVGSNPAWQSRGITRVESGVVWMQNRGDEDKYPDLQMVHGSKTERGGGWLDVSVTRLSQRCGYVGEFQGALAGTVPSPYKQGVAYLTNGGRMCCMESFEGRRGCWEKRDEKMTHRKGDSQPPTTLRSKYTGDRPRRPPASRPGIGVLSAGPVVAAFVSRL